MKKIIYAILICIIIAGIAVVCTMGFNVGLDYNKNVQIDIYVGKTVEVNDIRNIVNEVFPNETVIIQKVELFNDMVTITLPEKSDEELKDKIKELNTKVNEKYDIKNEVDDLTVTHNAKIRLSSIIKPYILPIAISTLIIVVFAVVRYRKLGIMKIFAKYVLSLAITEAAYASILAITRCPINRLVLPIGLLIYVITATILGFKNESKLAAKKEEEEQK